MIGRAGSDPEDTRTREGTRSLPKIPEAVAFGVNPNSHKHLDVRSQLPILLLCLLLDCSYQCGIYRLAVKFATGCGIPFNYSEGARNNLGPYRKSILVLPLKECCLDHIAVNSFSRKTITNFLQMKIPDLNTNYRADSKPGWSGMTHANCSLIESGCKRWSGTDWFINKVPVNFRSVLVLFALQKQPQLK